MALLDFPHHENNNAHTLMLVVALGIIAFFLISSTFFFKNKLFQNIFTKQRSFATGEELIPKVDLKVEYNGEIFDGVLNIPNEGSKVKLVWSTSNKPIKCTGRSWGLYSLDQTWDGEKKPTGGSFTSMVLDKNNPYVYTLDCSNEHGDSEGDSVAVNVGAEALGLKPAITFLNKEGIGDNSQLTVAWSGVNLNTPYSVCLTNGSWPINYQNIGRDHHVEDLVVSDEKIHKFTLFCSNESSFTKESLTIIK